MKIYLPFLLLPLQFSCSSQDVSKVNRDQGANIATTGKNSANETETNNMSSDASKTNNEVPYPTNNPAETNVSVPATNEPKTQEEVPKLATLNIFEFKKMSDTNVEIFDYKEGDEQGTLVFKVLSAQANGTVPLQKCKFFGDNDIKAHEYLLPKACPTSDRVQLISTLGFVYENTSQVANISPIKICRKSLQESNGRLLIYKYVKNSDQCPSGFNVFETSTFPNFKVVE